MIFRKSGGRQQRQSASAKARRRAAGPKKFEFLETRLVMTGTTLSAISGPDGAGVYDLPAGKDLYVPLLGSDSGQAVTYTVNSSNPSISAQVMPASNPVLELDVSGTTAGGEAFSGTMDFALFQNIAPDTVNGIVSLVDSGTYNGATFYRSETSTGFQLIQGGIHAPQLPNVAGTATLPDEFNQAGSFNSPGLMAMANAGAGTASSEFFVTAPNIPLVQDPLELNYGYTVFGQLLSGQAIYNDIEGVPTINEGGINYDNTPVTITSASIIPSASGVLQIFAPSGVTGTSNITVTATGADSTAAQQSFSVDAVAPAVANANTGQGTGGPVVLAPISNQTTSENTATGTIPLSASANFSGGTPTFSVTSNTPQNTAPVGVTANLTTPVNNAASFTLTPQTNWVGRFDLVAHVDDPIPSGGGFTVHDALPFSLTVDGQAQLSVNSSDSAGGASATSTTGAVLAGQQLTYTVTVSNTGSTNVSGVALTDTFPELFGVENGGVSTTGGAVDGGSGGTLQVANGVTQLTDSELSLPAGSTVTFTFTGVVSSSATAPNTLANLPALTLPNGTTAAGGSVLNATDNVQVKTLSVTPSGNTTSYTAGAAAALIDSAVTISASDTDITGATMTISSATLQSSDVLGFTNQDGIGGTYANGVLTLSGTATPAQYQAALRTVTFLSSSTSTTTRDISVVAIDGALNSAAASEQVDVFVPAEITGVFVNSSSWKSTFDAYLAGKGLGSATLGYAVPTGANQTKDLPWSNLNTIVVQFSEVVDVAEDSLNLAGGSSGSTPTVTGFSASPDGRTYTWTLSAPLTANQYLISVASTGSSFGTAVTDFRGAGLDGEFTTGVSSFPTGNGVAGGAFSFNFNVLPGDANQDGSISTADVGAVAAQINHRSSSVIFNPMFDFMGQGVINTRDTAMALGSIGSQLTGPAPSTPIGPLVSKFSITPLALGVQETTTTPSTTGRNGSHSFLANVVGPISTLVTNNANVGSHGTGSSHTATNVKPSGSVLSNAELFALATDEAISQFDRHDLDP